jgi:hypothetical protein
MGKPMRISPGSAIALSLSLLLCACQIEAGDNAGNAAGPAPPGQGGEAPAPAGEDRGEPANLAGEPAGGVELSALPAETRANSTVTLTLSNGSDEQVGYNLCTSALESAAGREVPTNRVCTMELRTLEPGRTATYGYRLPVNMLDGSYRFASQVHRMESGEIVTVRSSGFTVRTP